MKTISPRDGDLLEVKKDLQLAHIPVQIISLVDGDLLEVKHSDTRSELGQGRSMCLLSGKRLRAHPGL